MSVYGSAESGTHWPAGMLPSTVTATLPLASAAVAVTELPLDAPLRSASV